MVSQASGRVIINEIHWAGSDVSTADEWLELFGMHEPTDVSAWTLTTQSTAGEVTMFRFASGSVIASGQYLVISNFSAGDSRLAIIPDYVTTAVSLPNTQLLVRLKNASGAIIDTADDGVGVPLAGANPSGGGVKASMERILSDLSGSLKEAWQTAVVSIGFDPGAPVLGTPGSQNGGLLLMSSSSASSIVSSSASSSITPSSSSMSGSLSSSLSSENFSSVESSEFFSSSLSFTSESSFSGSVISSDSSDSFASSESSISSEPFIEPSSDSSYSSDSSESFSSAYAVNIKITEVLANPIGQDTHEWIEIGNFGSGSVDITGWILDEGNSAASFSILGASGALVILAPGEHRSFRKSQTGLPLDNKGEQVSLMSGGILIDAWEYIETAEEVSYGRTGTGSELKAFCVPTEGKVNLDVVPEVTIQLQTGSFSGEGKTSVNVEAKVQTGSLVSATCHFDFGDGFLSDSCNPPSHSYTTVGTYQLRLIFSDYCGNTVEQSQEILVLQKGKTTKQVNVSPTSGSSLALPSGPSGCTHTAPAGARISEVIPNPFGDDNAEWIELENLTDAPLPLCGWTLDDDDGGSAPYGFEIESIPARGFIVVSREDSKIALNNDTDQVQLRNPAGSIISSERYLKAPEGESWAYRNDGNYVWTPHLTPGSANRFRTAERRYASDRVIVAAALPNPVGLDVGSEWIELSNVSEEALDLTGWKLDNKDGGSKPFPLDGIVLSVGETRRFEDSVSDIQLVNSFDSARLLDPDGNVVALLSWTEAVEGRIYRPHAFSTERLKAKVVQVIDGDTFDVVFDNLESLERAPDSIKRRWAGVYGSDRPHIRVRMLGIDTPETVHPIKPVEEYGKEASNFTRSLMQEKSIELEFDTEIWDKYDRLLAYVYVQGSSVQSELLRRGLAFAYLRFPFFRSAEYVSYQEEARKAKLGLWSSAESSVYVLALQEGLSLNIILEEKPLEMEVDPAPGFVFSGTVISFVPSEPARLFLSVNSGSFQRFSGTYITTESAHLQAYGEVERMGEEGSGTIVRSEIFGGTYIVPSAAFGTGFLISEISASPLTPTPGPSPEGRGVQLFNEWIEFRNISDRDISLFGWTVDDVREKGSKPIVIKKDLVIPRDGFFVFNLSGSKIALNNDGDDVWLIAPGDKFSQHVSYPKLKKGQTYASTPSPSSTGGGETASSEKFCITDKPTPGAENECVIIVKEAKKKTSKEPKPKKAPKATSTSTGTKNSSVTALRIKYQNILDGFSAQLIGGSGSSTVRARLQKVRSEGQSTSENSEVNYTSQIEIMVITIGLVASLAVLGRAAGKT